MRIFLSIVFVLISFTGKAQINTADITIARDSFGVPHIFAKTDAEAAYGLAWAHAEDDFKTIQLVALSGKGLLGKALGKDGAKADYVVQLLHCREIVEEKYNSLTSSFLALINGYIEGLNDYASTHPKELMVKGAFPITVKEYLTSTTFSICMVMGVDEALSNIYAEKVQTLPGFESGGSNAIAISPSKTTTGEAFLAINAHQPLEGPVAFYEAQIQSDEGLNILGGLFPGAPCVLHGVNENLGWAHTVNYQDKIDVYQLQMNSANKNQYMFDGKWTDLEVKKVKLKVKGVPVAVKRDAYWSKYGAAIKTYKGVFAIRFAGNMDITALEQWYEMDKAKNFTEFQKALERTGIPMFNVMYADRFDTIFYVSNGRMPVRNPSPEYNWRSTLPGNTSKTLWTEFYPFSYLPQYINPQSGYLYNTNHSPFIATAKSDNLDSNKYDRNVGWETYNNNRSVRFSELIAANSKLDFETFKRIKFDRELPSQLQYRYKIDSIYNMATKDYPDIAQLLTTMQQWNKRGDADSKGAGIFFLMYYRIREQLAGRPERYLTTNELAATLRYAKDYAMQHFGKPILELGELQKLVRGKDEQPLSGIPDVLAAMSAVPYKDGKYKNDYGDAYIELVRFPKNSLPVIESVVSFGASSHLDSKHFNDQEQMYLQQKTKHMTLDKTEVLKNAEKIYHPGE